MTILAIRSIIPTFVVTICSIRFSNIRSTTNQHCKPDACVEAPARQLSFKKNQISAVRFDLDQFLIHVFVAVGAKLISNFSLTRISHPADAPMTARDGNLCKKNTLLSG
jgi:hypothetical protein